jgi:DNA-binding FrmR family transcriptional regulator
VRGDKRIVDSYPYFKHTIGSSVYMSKEQVKMDAHSRTHLEKLARLKRIEGQIQGIQRMIEEKRYGIDILTQLSAVAGTIIKVEENILIRHLESCVSQSFSKGSHRD